MKKKLAFQNFFWIVGLLVAIVFLSFLIYMVFFNGVRLSATIDNPVTDCTGKPDNTPCVSSIDKSGPVDAFAISGDASVGICKENICVPSGEDSNGPCDGDGSGPNDPKECRSRDGKTVICCARNDDCQTYKEKTVWCAPKKCPPEEGSPFTKRCENNGDAVCCLESEECGDYQGFAWCTTTKNSCEARGQGKECGKFGCCSSCPSDSSDDYALYQGKQLAQDGEKPCGSCKDYGVMKCSYQKCGAGQEICTGKIPGFFGGEISICCNEGKCIDGDIDNDGDYDRPPSCSDGDHDPFS